MGLLSRRVQQSAKAHVLPPISAPEKSTIAKLPPYSLFLTMLLLPLLLTWWAHDILFSRGPARRAAQLACAAKRKGQAVGHVPVLGSRGEVTEADVARIISNWTGEGGVGLGCACMWTVDSGCAEGDLFSSDER